MGSGWPGAGWAPSEPYRQSTLPLVSETILVQARDGAPRHLLVKTSTRTLCGARNVRMRRVLGKHLVPGWYNIATTTTRFQELLKYVTCSSCIAAWAARLIADNELC